MEGLTRQFRLRHKRDFQRLRREGRVTRHPALVISVGANDLVHNRYGFVTSKYLGTAVVRNRLRRLLREAVRMVHARLRPGNDIILIARPALTDLNLVEIQQVVKQLCQRANLWMEGD